MKKVILIILISFNLLTRTHAQDSFEDFKKRIESEFSDYSTNREKEFEDFRNKINSEYTLLLEKTWKEFKSFKSLPMPKEDRIIPPVVYPKDGDKEPIKDTPKPYGEIIPPIIPTPQPEPIVPIKGSTEPTKQYFYFFFYGTKLKVRLEQDCVFSLSSCSEKEIANAWKILSTKKYNDVITDCLQIRENNKLCDWAYLEMVQQMSDDFFHKHCNESVLLAAYVFCQSGYKMRLGYHGNTMYLLFASKHIIYNKSYWEFDGDKFYPLNCNEENLKICSAPYPKEESLSLFIGSEQLFTTKSSNNRNLQAKKYSNATANVSVNLNLIRFFDTYPTSMINQDVCTRWAMYANTPISTMAEQSLYPSLKGAISGKGQFEAANILLNFVQTAFEYEYDNKVWGYDRAFFAEETLYYPYCDCEDRSILFSRLVRDLLNLDVILVYYPGHLATAVHFSENISGDYISLNGKKFVICDPTYIGAPVGATMPKMDNSSAKVILLH